MWPDRRLLDLFKVEHPIVLAPMAGAVDANLAIAVAEGGGLAHCQSRCSTSSRCGRRWKKSARRQTSRLT